MTKSSQGLNTLLWIEGAGVMALRKKLTALKDELNNMDIDRGLYKVLTSKLKHLAKAMGNAQLYRT